ncbi:MAG: hypothetical protein ACFFD4_21955 [Candidatus Odinarchaeota archaeon]
MTTATGEARTGKKERTQPVCLKQPPKSRFHNLKPVIVVLLVFTLVVPPFLQLFGANDSPPPVASADEIIPDRATSQIESRVLSSENVADLVQTADGGLAVVMTARFDVTGDSDIMLVKTAADGTVQWSKTYGQSKSDSAGALVLTNDGGYAIAGHTTGWLPWVIKTDAGGNVEWNKTLSLSESKDEERSVESIRSIVQTGDGGFVLALNEWSPLVPVPDSNRRLLYKITSEGELEWRKNYRSNEENNPLGWCQDIKDMIQTSDGGFAVAGSIKITNKEFDMWLAKTDSTGNVEWSRSYGGSGYDASYFCNVIQTSDGGYALAGDSDGILFVKTDSTGNVEWINTLTLPRGVKTRRLAQTADGGYVFAGCIYTNPQTIFTTSYSFFTADWSTDAYLTKTNSKGNVEWSKKYGEPAASGTMAYHEAAVVLQTPDGGFALAGTSRLAYDVFENGPVEENGWQRCIESDGWLMKTDGNGNEEWKRVFDGRADEEWATDLVQTADGGLVFTGPAGSVDRKMDAQVARTDGDGILIWNRSYGGAEDDVPAAIIQTADGGLAIAGYTRSRGAGNSDAWLVKTSGNGVMTWDQTYGGPEDDGAEAVIQTADGGFALAGFARLRGDNNSDAWLVKTDENGTIEWNRTFGGDADDRALDLFQLANGSFVLLGYHGQEMIDADCLICWRHWDTFDHAWVLVVNETGNLLSQYVHERPGRVRFHDINSTGGGDSITIAGLSTSQWDWSTGWTSSTGNKSLIYLRIDDSGISQWERPLPYEVEQGDLVITASGDTVLAGYVRGKEYSAYLLLAKMDPDGAIQWISSYEVEHKFRYLLDLNLYWFAGIASVLIQLDDGGYALASGVMSRSLNGDSADAWLARFDENGTLAWEHAYGTGGIETGPEYYLFQAGTIILESDNDYNTLSFNTEAARAGGLPLIVLLGLVAVSITRKKKK